MGCLSLSFEVLTILIASDTLWRALHQWLLSPFGPYDIQGHQGVPQTTKLTYGGEVDMFWESHQQVDMPFKT